MPNHQLGPADTSDPYGLQHRKGPTQFLRKSVDSRAPNEEELGTIGAGTRIGNNGVGLGTLSNSIDMYDEYTIGSNRQPGLPPRKDYPDNMLKAQTSAPMLGDQSRLQSKMSINASYPEATESPIRRPVKDLTNDTEGVDNEQISSTAKATADKERILIIERNQLDNTQDAAKRADQPEAVGLSAHFDDRVVARILEE